MSDRYSRAVLAARGHLLYRVDGMHEGILYWSYVLVHAHKFAAFKLALASGNMKVQNFGRILAWGKGAQPDEASRRMLTREYGFELIV